MKLVLAIDGSMARLPNTDDVMATFGAPPEGSSVPLARFSRLYDVLNGLVIEVDRIPPGRRARACWSVPCCWNREVVLFTPGSHARQHCQTYGLATDPIPLRLIRVKLKNGEIEVLATSLLDEQTYCAGAWK